MNNYLSKKALIERMADELASRQAPVNRVMIGRYISGLPDSAATWAISKQNHDYVIIKIVDDYLKQKA